MMPLEVAFVGAGFCPGVAVGWGAERVRSATDCFRPIWVFEVCGLNGCFDQQRPFAANEPLAITAEFWGDGHGLNRPGYRGGPLV